MQKPKRFSNIKHHYDVFYVGYGEGCYAKNYRREFVGSTWAVSPEKACSNVRYRLRDDKYPHGGYSYDVMGDSAGMGSVSFSFEAVRTD